MCEQATCVGTLKPLTPTPRPTPYPARLPGSSMFLDFKCALEGPLHARLPDTLYYLPGRHTSEA